MSLPRRYCVSTGGSSQGPDARRGQRRASITLPPESAGFPEILQRGEAKATCTGPWGSRLVGSHPQKPSKPAVGQLPCASLTTQGTHLPVSAGLWTVVPVPMACDSTGLCKRREEEKSEMLCRPTQVGGGNSGKQENQCKT